MNKLTSKTRKAFLAAGLLSGAALSSIVLAAPANAACPTGQLLSTLPNSMITCGDKTYKFGATPFTGFLATDTFSIAQTLGIHSLSILSGGGWTPGTYELDYTVDATDPTTQKIYSYSTGLTGPSSSSPAGSYSMLNTASIPGNLGAPLTATATLPLANGPLSFFTPPVTSATFETTLIVTNGFVTQVTSDISQRAPVSEVPGPLPLLGAGAAFGFSRRIRSRIKAAA